MLILVSRRNKGLYSVSLYSFVRCVCTVGSEPRFERLFFYRVCTVPTTIIYLKRKLEKFLHTNFYQINSHSLLAVLRANCTSICLSNWLDFRGAALLRIPSSTDKGFRFRFVAGVTFVPSTARNLTYWTNKSCFRPKRLVATCVTSGGERYLFGPHVLPRTCVISRKSQSPRVTWHFPKTLVSEESATGLPRNNFGCYFRPPLGVFILPLIPSWAYLYSYAKRVQQVVLVFEIDFKED